MTTLRRYLLLAPLALLAACAGDEFGDLKQELDQLTKDLRGKVDPLPKMALYEPAPYTMEKEIDPFRPERIQVAQPAGATPASATGARKPDLARPREPLEAFPLESITMVGTLTRGPDTYALVRAGANLYRIGKGNYLGQNFGVVVAIDENQVMIKELVQEGGNEWVERTSTLQLQEVRR